MKWCIWLLNFAYFWKSIHGVPLRALALFILSTLPATKCSLKCNLSPSCPLDRILNCHSNNYVVYKMVKLASQKYIEYDFSLSFVFCPWFNLLFHFLLWRVFYGHVQEKREGNDLWRGEQLAKDWFSIAFPSETGGLWVGEEVEEGVEAE